MTPLRRCVTPLLVALLLAASQALAQGSLPVDSATAATAPTINVAIGALLISFLSLAVTIINSVFTAKTYKKNRRLEFLQRRDRLSQRISDLSDRNAEFQIISARFELVAVKNAGLALQGEDAERNTALIASIKLQRDGVEKGIKLWDDEIGVLHSIYSNLTSETDAPEVERMITIIQVASDSLKKASIGYSSVLEILETTNEVIKTSLAERDEKIRQINLDTDESIRQISLDFERAMGNLTSKK